MYDTVLVIGTDERPEDSPIPQAWVHSGFGSDVDPFAVSHRSRSRPSLLRGMEHHGRAVPEGAGQARTRRWASTGAGRTVSQLRQYLCEAMVPVAADKKSNTCQVWQLRLVCVSFAVLAPRNEHVRLKPVSGKRGALWRRTKAPSTAQGVVEREGARIL